jgi:hypothetical protein
VRKDSDEERGDEVPDTTHIRSSHDTVLPGDVTDPLLWRTAYDVAAAHQPDETGRCPSLLCGGRPAPCDTLVRARQAMQLARAGAPAETPVPAQQAAPRLRDRSRRRRAA